MSFVLLVSLRVSSVIWENSLLSRSIFFSVFVSHLGFLFVFMVFLRSTCFSPLYLFQGTDVAYIAQLTSHRYSLGCVDDFVVISIQLITLRVSISSLFGHFPMNVVCYLFFKPCSFGSRKIALAWFNRSVYLSGIALSRASV